MIKQLIEYLLLVSIGLAILVSNIMFSISVKATDNQSTDLTKVNYYSFLSRSIYENISKEVCMPQLDVFEKALKGYYKLKANQKLLNENILTVIDFRLSSNEKRMWVFDIKKQELLYHTLVAHGKNSGEEFANVFSNKIESYQSSLGFYVTGEMYDGKHGLSLMLDGQEQGFNSNARERAVVMHGADYVSEKYIAENGRLGRSFGCPAISRALQHEIIPIIANQSCLFIYFPNKKYEANSKFINASDLMLDESLACLE